MTSGFAAVLFRVLGLALCLRWAPLGRLCAGSPWYLAHLPLLSPPCVVRRCGSCFNWDGEGKELLLMLMWGGGQPSAADFIFILGWSRWVWPANPDSLTRWDSHAESMSSSLGNSPTLQLRQHWKRPAPFIPPAAFVREGGLVVVWGCSVFVSVDKAA